MDGEWFYKRWNNAVDSDDLFIQDNNGIEIFNPDINIQKTLTAPGKNEFIKVQYHWKEDPTKNDIWYQTQVRELDDERLVNQELELIFVGTKNCIFSDTILKSLEPSDKSLQLPTPNHSTLRTFDPMPDDRDYYLIGVDTAQSLTGAKCAIEIFSFKDFKQIAELEHSYSSYTDFGMDIHFVFQWLYKLVGPRIILAIENNTIGQAPIEILTRHITDFVYHPFLYREEDKDEFGIKTTGQSKNLFIGCLMEFVNANPKHFKSKDLINQFSSMERRQGGAIKSTGYSDLFMAACFCAYVRKSKELEILPQVQFSTRQLQDKYMDDIKFVSSLTNPKSILKQKYIEKQMILTSEDDSQVILPYVEDDDAIAFFPIFNQ